MRIESRIKLDGGSFCFQIVDVSDTTEVDGEVLAEELFYSEKYAREDTAERNAKKWLAQFQGATDAIRRKMCGYDPVRACTRPPIVLPVRRRIGP